MVIFFHNDLYNLQVKILIRFPNVLFSPYSSDYSQKYEGIFLLWKKKIMFFSIVCLSLLNVIHSTSLIYISVLKNVCIFSPIANKMVIVPQNQWTLCRIKHLSLYYSVKGYFSYDIYEAL